MNDVNKFSNLQVAMENMSALQDLVIGMPSTQNTLSISPEVVKQMQWAQKFASSPAYQAILKQQEILNKMAIPASLMPELQATNNLIQPALQNINFDNLTKIVQSENFFKSVLVVQNASINFLEEMKKLDNYQQKTLGEILNEIRLKKTAEVELPEDFPTRLKKSFKNLIESGQNFWNEHEDDIIAILPNIQTIVDYISTGEISNLGAVLAISLSLRKILRGENFGRKQ